jgi:hypothetical protein
MSIEELLEALERYVRESAEGGSQSGYGATFLPDGSYNPAPSVMSLKSVTIT